MVSHMSLTRILQNSTWTLAIFNYLTEKLRKYLTENVACFVDRQNIYAERCRSADQRLRTTDLNSEILLNLISKMKYLAEECQLYFVLTLPTTNSYISTLANIIGILTDNLPVATELCFCPRRHTDRFKRAITHCPVCSIFQQCAFTINSCISKQIEVCSC